MLIEDPNLISSKINELNRSGGSWIVLSGFNALTTVSYTPNDGLIFNPNVGYPVKAFLNQTTGEIRLFDARKFLRAQRYG